MKRAPITLVLIIIVMLGLAACAANTKAQGKPKSPVKPKDKAAEQVRIQVDSYKPNIFELYKKHTQDAEMKGLVSITLYLAEDGTVAMCDVSPKRGNLSNTFLLELEKMINQWTFKNSGKIAYSFMLNLE